MGDSIDRGESRCPAFEVWLAMFLAGGDEEHRRSALRASLLMGSQTRFFEPFESNYVRVGHRRWAI